MLAAYVEARCSGAIVMSECLARPPAHAREVSPSARCSESRYQVAHSRPCAQAAPYGLRATVWPPERSFTERNRAQVLRTCRRSSPLSS